MKVGDKAYLFDVLQANTGVMQHLQAILEDSNVVKVMVDCRNDSAALMYQKGIEICNIFDLQVDPTVAFCKLHTIIPTILLKPECRPQVADGLVGLWKGVYGQQHSRDLIGLQKLLVKYNMPPLASKTGADWLPSVCSPPPTPHCKPVGFLPPWYKLVYSAGTHVSRA